MSHLLTENQKSFARWLVRQVREAKLSEEFLVTWIGPEVGSESGLAQGIIQVSDHPAFTKGTLDALGVANLLICTSNYETTVEQITSYFGPQARHKQTEVSRTCTLTAKAYEAVDSNFSAPDISFVKQLTPLADITNLDNEIKHRCLPILGAGSADPKLWDSAVRTAGVILEERLRDIGRIADSARIGRDLVNDVFGATGTLAPKILNPSERQGYRDMYAGIVGVFRNPYSHRHIDPTPEDGGAFIVFVNFLLRMLEDLR